MKESTKSKVPSINGGIVTIVPPAVKAVATAIIVIGLLSAIVDAYLSNSWF